MRACIDLDDGYRLDDIEERLVPLHEAVPQLRLTLYTIPLLFGDVRAAAARYPWITFASHGWSHAFAECRAWTTELAHAILTRTLELGYAPLTKPPQWICDVDLEEACRDLGITLHVHEDYKPKTVGLRYYVAAKRRGITPLHTHLIQNPSTDWIGDHPDFTVERLSRFTEFVTPLELATTFS